MCTLSIYSGQELLQTALKESLGKFGASEIDQDITNLAGQSQPGLAKALVEGWVSECGLVLEDIAGENCTALQVSAKWLGIWMYTDLDMKSRECDKQDYRYRQHCCDQVIRFLGSISPCLSEKANAFLTKSFKKPRSKNKPGKAF